MMPAQASNIEKGMYGSWSCELTGETVLGLIFSETGEEVILFSMVDLGGLSVAVPGHMPFRKMQNNLKTVKELNLRERSKRS